MDNSWYRLGKLLVDYSMAVKPGEKVMIAFGEVESYPLVHSVYRACLEAGAYPQVQFLSEELNRLALLHGSNEQIGWVPEVEAFGMEWADVYFVADTMSGRSAIRLLVTKMSSLVGL